MTNKLLMMGLAPLLSSCGLVEKKHLVGNYYLVAANAPEQMEIIFNSNPGERQSQKRIGETVYAVGWNDDYLVAKQHPRNDRRIENYYYLEIRRDYEFAAPNASVIGPLTEAEFKRRKAQLGLPEFRMIIDSLE